MAEATLTPIGITQGVWHGVLRRDGTGDWRPDPVVTHLGREIEGLEIAEDGPGAWRLSLPIPVDLIADGVQTFVITERGDEAVLETFSIVAGAPLAEDLRAEITLLRAELDMLKRAFRRHCLETM